MYDVLAIHIHTRVHTHISYLCAYISYTRAHISDTRAHISYIHLSSTCAFMISNLLPGQRWHSPKGVSMHIHAQVYLYVYSALLTEVNAVLPAGSKTFFAHNLHTHQAHNVHVCLYVYPTFLMTSNDTVATDFRITALHYVIHNSDNIHNACDIAPCEIHESLCRMSLLYLYTCAYIYRAYMHMMCSCMSACE